MKPTSPILRGATQRAVFNLICDLADSRGIVWRHAIVEHAIATGCLGIAKSAVEPTITRVLHRLYEVGLIDVNDTDFCLDFRWLREGLLSKASVPAEVEAKAIAEAASRVGDAAVGDALEFATTQRAQCKEALLSGRWEDAKRAFWFEVVRVVKVIDRPTANRAGKRRPKA